MNVFLKIEEVLFEGLTELYKDSKVDDRQIKEILRAANIGESVASFMEYIQQNKPTLVPR